MVIWLVASSVANAQAWPPGANIQDAASVQVSRDGFQGLSDLVPAVIPAEPIPLDPITQGSGLFSISLTNGWIGLEATNVDLVPGLDVLDVTIDILVNINDDLDKFNLDYSVLFSDSCTGYVEPFPVSATLPVSLEVVTGPEGKPVLDATIGTAVVTNELESKYIQLDCATGDILAIDALLDKFTGFSLVELLIDYAQPLIEQQIQSQTADIEAQIETALQSAYLNQDVDVNGVMLHLELYPQDVTITPDGMDLRMQGLSSAPPAECTTEFDTLGGSIRTDGTLPPVTQVPTDADAGLVLSDDWPDQALYSIWRGGVLCYDLSNGQIALPIALDTGMLGLLGGDPFRALWPDAKPMIVRTEPRLAPVMKYDGVHDLVVVAHDVGVEFYAELDYRNVHALGVAIDLDAGVDVALDSTTGDMAVQVALGDDEIAVRVPSDEFARGTEASIGTAFEGLVGSFIEPLLGDALQSLSFGLPNLNGVGLQSLTLAPHGDPTWLGAWASVGPVTYTGSSGCGCGGCGGSTDTAATDTGSTGGTCNGGPAAPVVAVLLAGAFLRRRRRN